MARIASALSRVKDRIDEHLDPGWVESACASAGHVWRERLLDPGTTLRLVVLQVLHGNVACRALRHVGGMRASPTAYCKARTRLPIDVFGFLCAMVIASLRDASDGPRKSGAFQGDLRGECGGHFRGCGFRGHRVWMIDGSGVSTPDTPALQEAFGEPAGMKPGCGFPGVHGLLRMDLSAGFIDDFVAGPCAAHDLSSASRLHGSMGDGDVLLGGRTFGSWGHFGLILRDNLRLVAREHQRRKPPQRAKGRRGRKRGARRGKRGTRRGGRRGGGRATMRVVRTLGRDDELVELDRPKRKPKWMSEGDRADLPATLTLRRVSYRITLRGCRTKHVTLTTMLTDPRKYSRQALAQLYLARWRIETNLCHLKQTMGMNVLRCKSRDGVMKELWVYVLVYNLVRRVMLCRLPKPAVPIQSMGAAPGIRASCRHRPSRMVPRDRGSPGLRARRSQCRIRPDPIWSRLPATMAALTVGGGVRWCFLGTGRRPGPGPSACPPPRWWATHSWYFAWASALETIPNRIFRGTPVSGSR